MIKINNNTVDSSILDSHGYSKYSDRVEDSYYLN